MKKIKNRKSKQKIKNKNKKKEFEKPGMKNGKKQMK